MNATNSPDALQQYDITQVLREILKHGDSHPSQRAMLELVDLLERELALKGYKIVRAPVTEA